MSRSVLVKRIAASAFVLVGGFAIVKYLWPEGVTGLPLHELTVGHILTTAGAVVAALVSLGLVWSFWTEK
ncbi:MAG TPA: hypothetical protein VFJ70_05030 [Burkholderiales bacterium]|nr:hypothetical protein [Burkholderiales bacterium]